MKLVDVLNESITHHFCVLRSENEILNDKEIDLIGLDDNLVSRYVKLLLMSGLVLDRLSSNSPHVKLTDYNDSSLKIKEYDLVHNICFFDNSRCFNLVHNINDLSFEEKKTKGLSINVLGEYERYIILLLHSYTDKKTISNKYREELLAISEGLNNEKLRAKLSNFKLNKYLFFLIEKEFYSTVNIWGRPLRFGIFCYAALTQPIRLISFFIKKVSRLLRTIKNKIFKFKVLVFMGADGSGKTTTINELMSYLGENDCYYVHMGNKSNFLPTTKIINFIRANKKESIPLDSLPKNQGTSSFCMSRYIKSVIYNANVHAEVFSHMSWILLKNKLFLKKKYILVDRYIYDRYSTGKVGCKYRMHISPDFIFLLDASLDTLLARKQEHPKEVIEGFQKKYLEFLLEQKIAKCARINSENEIHSNVNLISRILNNEY